MLKVSGGPYVEMGSPGLTTPLLIWPAMFVVFRLKEADSTPRKHSSLEEFSVACCCHGKIENKSRIDCAESIVNPLIPIVS